MSDATFTFRPYLTMGMSANVPLSGNDTHGKTRVIINMEGGQSAEANISLIGPGEIRNISTRVINRIYPQANATKVESNYFPFIEFTEADFPWRYTPENKNEERSRLRPWLTLVVLCEGEFQFNPSNEEKGLLPQITQVNISNLPNLDQSWAWAHVQIVGELADASSKSIQSILEKNPQRIISRILSPRYLQTNQRYHSFLVPTFERGRLQGLGILDNKSQPVPARQNAWEQQRGGTVDLPVYYHWEFTTSSIGGDFETLAKNLLPPSPLSASVGYKEMDVRNLGYGLPPTTGKVPATFYMKGALISPDGREHLNELEPSATLTPFFENSFRSLLNQAGMTVELEDDETLLPVGPPLYGRWHAGRNSLPEKAEKEWFHQVNMDLSMRAAAGLGAQIVRKNQESLMASAWDQLPEIERTNQQLIQYQLSLELSKCLYKKHFQSLPQEDSFRLTGKVQDQVQLRNSSQTVQSALQSTAVPKTVFSTTFKRKTRNIFKNIQRDSQQAREEKKSLTARFSEGKLKLFQPLESVSEEEGEPEVPTRVFSSRGEITVLPKINSIHSQLLEGINPATTILQPVTERIQLPEWMNWPVGDSNLPPLEPIMEAPEFVQPMYEDLRNLSADWLLPGVEHIPNNTISLLETNQVFIEGLMVGLNHEMARELLWREYPTDQRGTYFRQFWDVTSYPTNPDVDLRDITLLTEWGNLPLGEHRPNADDGSSTLVLIIRGDLLFAYPNTAIYAQKATFVSGDTSKRVLGTEKKYPIFKGFIPPDIQFYGFPLDNEEVIGQENEIAEEQGWFFVLKENASEPRYGLDLDPYPFNSTVDSWDNLSWNHLVPEGTELDSIKFIDLNLHQPTIADNGGYHWNGPKANSADLAYISYRKPFLAAIHGSDMLLP
ncbi:MAG: hypothetical protein ACFB15_09525 [Cyclobacteriaceae bacterium]